MWSKCLLDVLQWRCFRHVPLRQLVWECFPFLWEELKQLAREGEAQEW